MYVVRLKGDVFDEILAFSTYVVIIGWLWFTTNRPYVQQQFIRCGTEGETRVRNPEWVAPPRSAASGVRGHFGSSSH